MLQKVKLGIAIQFLVRSRLLIRNWSAKNDALSRYLRNLRMISDKLKKVEEDLQSFLKKFYTNPNLKMGEAGLQE